jgi:ABC-type sugar transport system ATPase subunit
MDEPLSNLDAKLRESLRVELKHIQKTQHSTTLFVTHDQIEALTMADRIAVLKEGRIVQVGAPTDIYDRPATTFVAQLVGTPRINLFEAAREDGKLNIKGSELHLPAPLAQLPEALLVGIRPEDVRPDPHGPFAGEVMLTEPLGVETIVHIKSGEQTLLSLVSGISPLRRGDAVRFSIMPEKVHCFGMDRQRIS